MGAYCMSGRDENCTQKFSRASEKNVHSGNIIVDGKVIF
jgi:hypothetical protein